MTPNKRLILSLLEESIADLVTLRNQVTLGSRPSTKQTYTEEMHNIAEKLRRDAEKIKGGSQLGKSTQ